MESLFYWDFLDLVQGLIPSQGIVGAFVSGVTFSSVPLTASAHLYLEDVVSPILIETLHTIVGEILIFLYVSCSLLSFRIRFLILLFLIIIRH